MTRIFYIFLGILLLSVSFSACKRTNDGTELAQKFMYPYSDAPYVYVFQDSLDPFFEMFERIVTYYDPLGNHLLIERYNSNFMLLESYDLLYDRNFQVFNHILYFGQSQIIAQVSDSTFVPWQGSGVFSSSFKGTADGIMFQMKNNKSLVEERGVFSWNGEELATLQVLDSISTIAVDLNNNLEKPASTVAIHEFAEGIGRVRIRTLDGSSNLVLKAIISESDWKKLITK
jgi:hypothetical protein